jgi:hypothetical protein
MTVFLAIVLHTTIVGHPRAFWPHEPSYAAELGLEIGCMALLNSGSMVTINSQDATRALRKTSSPDNSTHIND